MRLDLERMRIDLAKPVTGVVDTSWPLHFELRGPWHGRVPRVLVDGKPFRATLAHDRDVAAVALPAGRSRLQLPAR